MRNGWMEEKLGEDRSDSFVAMRLEKLKIKDPINSFRRCPFYLFLSVQHPKICWSRSCSFYVGRGLKQKWISKEMTNFQNNLLKLHGSCVLTFFRMEVLCAYPRECQTTQYRIVFFIIYISDHRPAMLYNEWGQAQYFQKSRKAWCCPVYCSIPYCFEASEYWWSMIIDWNSTSSWQRCKSFLMCVPLK